MAARHVYTFTDPVRERDLEVACQLLADGGILAVPTDTNWSFICDADNTRALDRIRKLKPTHPREKPFSLMCASISAAADVVNIDNIVYPFLKKALPGPYTIILNRNRSLPRLIHDNRREVGIRIPDAPLVLELMKRYGRVLAAATVPPVEAPGDGIEGPRYPRFGYEILESFGHGLDLILDLGDELSGVETTVVNCTAGLPEIVRQGAGDAGIFGGVR